MDQTKEAKKEAKKPDGDKQDVTVTVYAPGSTEGRQITWPKSTKVGDAAAEAATTFGLAAGTFTLSRGGDVLDRNKPLVAEKVHDGDELDLVDAGGGV